MMSRKKILLLILTAAVVGFTSCSSDDDVISISDPIEEPKGLQMGSFTLPNTPLFEKIVFVENLTMPNDGWIVVRRDDGENKPLMSGIISLPEYVEAGSYTEYSMQLQENINLNNGERLWVNLHDDNGDQVFSFNGNNNEDIPLGIFDPFAGYLLISNSFIVDLPAP